MTRLPKEEELLQLPGRGPLDFTPLLHGTPGYPVRGLDRNLHAPGPARDTNS